MQDVKNISFDHYFEASFDVASNEEMMSTMAYAVKKTKPHRIVN